MVLEALIRTGSRESGKLDPIGMEEALRTAAMWLSASVHQGNDEQELRTQQPSFSLYYLVTVHLLVEDSYESR